jgi:hypothetical protein
VSDALTRKQLERLKAAGIEYPWDPRQSLKLLDRIGYLEKRRDSHLRTIRRLSMDAITPEEAAELRGQIASLIAEVGTLRARLKH